MEIKCDDCKVTIGTTDSVRESAAGGHCDSCARAGLVHEIGQRSREASCGATPEPDRRLHLAAMDWLITCPACRSIRNTRPAGGHYWTRKPRVA